MIDTTAVLTPQDFVTSSIGLNMYSLLTENSARGAVRVSNRLYGGAQLPGAFCCKEEKHAYASAGFPIRCAAGALNTTVVKNSIVKPYNPFIAALAKGRGPSPRSK